MNEAAEGTRRYSISEAAVLLDRSPHTLRSWDRNGSMPEHLRPERDVNGNRYWTEELIDEIKQWIAENGFHPGRGIDYHPSPEQLASHIQRIRRSTAGKPKGKRQLGLEHEEFRAMVIQAINELQLDQDRIIKMLPDAIKQYPTVSLKDALAIASDVFAQSE